MGQAAVFGTIIRPAPKRAFGDEPHSQLLYGPGFLQPGLQKSSGYPESARCTRGTAQSVFVFFRQIQQAPSRELIGIFGEAAAPVSLLLQK
jgi:hypothetical protein